MDQFIWTPSSIQMCQLCLLQKVFSQYHLQCVGSLRHSFPLLRGSRKPGTANFGPKRPQPHTFPMSLNTSLHTFLGNYLISLITDMGTLPFRQLSEHFSLCTLFLIKHADTCFPADTFVKPFINQCRHFYNNPHFSTNLYNQLDFSQVFDSY